MKLGAKDRVYIFTLFLVAVINCFLDRKAQAQSLEKLKNLPKQVTVVEGNRIHRFYLKSIPDRLDPENDREYFWYRNFQLQNTQGHVEGKMLDGGYTLTSDNNQVLETGEFKDGLRHGEWKKWNANGKLQTVTTWKEGKQDGPFQKYDYQGRLTTEGNYKDALLHGKIKEFNRSGETQVKEYRFGEFIDKEKLAEEKKLEKEAKKAEREAKKEDSTDQNDPETVDKKNKKTSKQPKPKKEKKQKSSSGKKKDTSKEK